MFYPFCDASELKISNTSSYFAKIKLSGVIDITHQNIALIEPFSELVHAAFAEFKIGLIGIPLCSRRMMKMTMSYLKQNMMNMNKISMRITMEEIYITNMIIYQVRSQI